jgi:hypothetical protein
MTGVTRAHLSAGTAGLDAGNRGARVRAFLGGAATSGRAVHTPRRARPDHPSTYQEFYAWGRADARKRVRNGER